jgi:hypothetical protein
VEQVSRPALIALLATVAFAGAWFTVLRPKSDTGAPAPTATAPGTAGLGRAVAKAKGAVAASDAAAKRSEQAAAAAGSGGTAAATAKPAPAAANAPAKAKPVVAAKPATPVKLAKPALPTLQPGDQSGPILRELASGKTVVAIFFNGAGADDHAALRAVRATDRRGGRVAVHAIQIAKVGAYNALTTGVQVMQAPTILVIGPDHKARTIVGYTEVKEIDQTVFDIGGFAKKHKR